MAYGGSSERELWLAVIARALSDATMLFSDYCGEDEEIIQDEAIHFLFHSPSDFEFVCSLAGVDGPLVTKYANYLLDAGQYWPYVSGLSRMIELSNCQNDAITHGVEDEICNRIEPEWCDKE